jgi:hypothetical protein
MTQSTQLVQLAKPTKSSTGGIITYTKTGLIHTQK